MQDYAKNRFKQDKYRLSKNSFLLLLTAIVLAANCVLATGAHAVETQMMIEFQKKLQKKLENIQHTTKSMQTMDSSLNDEKKKITQEFAQTSNREDQRYLLKKYHAVRAKSALNAAKGINNMQDTIEEMIGDLEHLDRMNMSNGVNGAAANSAAHKALAKNVMVGLGELSKTVTALDPTNEKMIGIRERLAMNDAAFKSYFSRNNFISIPKQIEFLEDNHSTLAAALKLLGREKENLRIAQLRITGGEIEDIIIKINTNSLIPIYESIMNDNDQMIEMIHTVNNSPGAQKRQTIANSYRSLGDW